MEGEDPMKVTDAQLREEIIKLEGPFTVRGAHRALLDGGLQISWCRVSETVTRLMHWGQLEKISGEKWPTYMPTGRERYEIPTTPCSVVWFDGHPWVLDGEPGISRRQSPRYWIGSKRNTTHGLYELGWMTEEEMAMPRPAIVYQAPED